MALTLYELGRSGLRIAPIALGGNVFGWTADEATSFRILDAFVDAGGNFIDTADVYSRWAAGNQGGESETIIGRWLARRGKRDDVVVATKVGAEMRGATGLSAARIREAIDASLQRLQTDVIDLYQSHYDDAATPLAETLGTFGELIAAGKVRAIGASNISLPRLTEAVKLSETADLPRYESLQPHYNLMDRAEFEGSVQMFCVERQIGVIPYYGLARGFLTGKYRSDADLATSARGGGVKPYMNERGARVLAALDDVAQRYGTTPARVALAWLRVQPSIAAPIASVTKPEHVADLIGAATLQLDAHALDRLTDTSNDGSM